ncbi:hypothetical protein [Caenispirillum bisanense]|uniref:hypothetical protein n=1 Tax=Caenispirillum bisanense TaxID=414052 RepID=UPI0031DEE1EC
MSYLKQWQAAKKQFETATGKKKPSESVLGVFRKSSGLESACKTLDAALAKPTLDSTEKAMVVFMKAREDYVKQLEKADKADKTDDYRKEIGKLSEALDSILMDYSVKKQEALNNAPRPLTDILGRHAKDLCSTDFLKKPGVKWFATAKEVQLSGVDGKPLPEAIACQKRFLASLKQYDTAVKTAKATCAKAFVVKAGIKEAVKQIGLITDAVSPMTEGARYHYMMWVEAQGKAFRDAGRAGDMRTFIEQGPLSAKIAAVGSLLEDEAGRLNNLEADIRDLHR